MHFVAFVCAAGGLIGTGCGDGATGGESSPSVTVPAFQPAPEPEAPAPNPSPAAPDDAPSEGVDPALPLEPGPVGSDVSAPPAPAGTDSDDGEPPVDAPQPNDPPPAAEDPSCAPWPESTGSEQVTATIEVSGTFDGGLRRFTGAGALGSGDQDEDQPAFFRLRDGAVLRNVILGAPAADGIHCDGSCTLENVWWEDVGEDAATFRGQNASAVMTVRCAGARQAADKIFQHNGAGTLIIEDFSAEDFGKVYRSCGNCRQQFERHVQMRNVVARDGDTLAGINENFGDTARFESVSAERDITICERYQGNATGAEPTRTGEGPDAEHCLYQESDIQPL